MAPRDPQAPPIIEEEWASFALGTISWFGYWFLHVCKRYGRSRDANIWLDRKFRCSMAPVVTVIRWGSFCWGDLFPNVRFLKRLPIYLNEIFETSDHLFRSDARANLKVRNLPFTLRMSQDYRFYDDRWQSDRSVEDEPLDMSAEFEASQEIMAEIAAMISSQGILPNDIEKLISVEMTKVALGSNKIERLGLGLDETFRLCLAVFEGGQELEIMDRYGNCSGSAYMKFSDGQLEKKNTKQSSMLSYLKLPILAKKPSFAADEKSYSTLLLSSTLLTPMSSTKSLFPKT